ncbi:unnamed protein product [marine sediment metagenome]|uniref:Uncharacterized protein n=1 Tax=marine sediment metagenome TaxID=412755 RepID=X0ZJ52_9ZZZZ
METKVEITENNTILFQFKPRDETTIKIDWDVADVSLENYCHGDDMNFYFFCKNLESLTK